MLHYTACRFTVPNMTKITASRREPPHRYERHNLINNLGWSRRIHKPDSNNCRSVETELLSQQRSHTINTQQASLVAKMCSFVKGPRLAGGVRSTRSPCARSVKQCAPCCLPTHAGAAPGAAPSRHLAAAAHAPAQPHMTTQPAPQPHLLSRRFSFSTSTAAGLLAAAGSSLGGKDTPVTSAVASAGTCKRRMMAWQ